MMKVCAFVALLCISPMAHAFFGISIPTKLQSCELFLKSNLQVYKSKASVLPAVTKMRSWIEETIPSAKSDEGSPYNTGYSGDIGSLGKAKAAKLVKRLNGIEMNLDEPGLDTQIVSFEIRGDDIRKALENLEPQEKELARIYKEQKRRLYPKGARALTGTVQAVLGLLAVIYVPYLAIDRYQDWTPRSLVAGPFLLMTAFIGEAMARYWLNQFDWRYGDLKKTLREVTREDLPKRDRIFISSFGFSMPAEMQEALMSSEPVDEESRKIAMRDREGSPVLNDLMAQFNRAVDIASRVVRNAGEPIRLVLLDNIVYYDKEKNEPVWLVIYRSFRFRRGGRPSPRELDAPAQEEFGFGGGVIAQ